MVRDPVEDNLRDIIAAKQKGRKPAVKATKESQPAGNVVNIMDALRRSLAAERK
jgi:DNA end-binding protein Ku